MPIPEELEDAYAIIPIVLSYHASSLKMLKQDTTSPCSKYDFASQIQTIFAEDLDEIIQKLETLADNIRQKNASEEWMNTPVIIRDNEELIKYCLAHYLHDLERALDLVYYKALKLSRVELHMEAVDMALRAFRLKLPGAKEC